MAAATLTRTSCGGNSEATPEETAKTYMESLTKGDYDQATRLTLALDSAPADYQSLYKARYKQMAETAKTSRGNITDITVTQTTMVTDNEAEVHMRLTFDDQTTSDIALRLVRHNQRWVVR